MPRVAMYKRLGLTPGSCTLGAARSAYRRQALNCHPDVLGGSEEKFKALKDAMDFIEDDLTDR
eukprot:gene24411-1566_t